MLVVVLYFLLKPNLIHMFVFNNGVKFELTQIQIENFKIFEI